MLDIINRYAHGFVAIPVILACREQGIFAQLQRHDGLRPEQMRDATGANGGHLEVALRLLVSLGWLIRDAAGIYRVTEAAESHQQIPGDIIELLRLSPETALKSQQASLLRKWVTRVLDGWPVNDPLIADFLDGLLVIPLLLALKQRQKAGNQPFAELFMHLPVAVRKPLTKIFVHKGWGVAEKNALFLTEVGQFMLDRALITGVTASYAPMLRRMPEVLFGSHQQVFQREAFGGESHIDRTLNVLASGFQHDKYFIQVDEVTLAVFNRLPFAEQPKYVADMGCGDGSLLKRVYETVRDKSERGKVLDRYPLTLLGIDYNQESLAATARTLYLHDFPHRVLHGDIGDPERMIMDLADQGIRDPENIWNIRSFLDHDRPYIPPVDPSAVEDRAHLRYHGVYVDQQGQAIPAATMVQSLREHLGRWASITGKHGLMILEVHCLDPATVRVFLDQSESLHFDACQGFSMQHLMEADVFLMAAAEAGLFAKPEFSRYYPKTFPFTRITLNWFEKRPYHVRHARPGDLPALVTLEQACWQPELQASEMDLSRRLARFPEGQCVLEMDGRIAGVIYSQRISSVAALEQISHAEVPALHRPDGPVVQLIAVNILPDRQHLGLGDQLLEFMLQY